ncbi:MAG: glutamine amidotransferase family protein [Clostridia bacterium]|nr:glutamine amidotransferase family protein [Clostridia bacterium]
MCGIAGFISQDQVRENGQRIRKAIVLQNDRGNGLGAGYGAYGIFPEYKDLYAFQIACNEKSQHEEVYSYLIKYFKIHHQDRVKVWGHRIKNYPLIVRFFLEPKHEHIPFNMMDDTGSIRFDDYVIGHVMHINSNIQGAYVFSSGKNMGVFKGVGTPEEIYDFYCLDEYEAYCWIAHNRFPTNTPGWWGGAHPMNLLGWSIVHNGEISSYGINRRYLEIFGYKCNLQTDSEVVVYLLDLLIRQHGLSIEDATRVLAPPYWSEIKRMKNNIERNRLIGLKTTYESAMLNGPFAILCAHDNGLFSLTDNTKLRPMSVGVSKGYKYFSSEISALYEMDNNLEEIFAPRAGEPVIVEYTRQVNVSQKQAS